MRKKQLEEGKDLYMADENKEQNEDDENSEDENSGENLN